MSSDAQPWWYPQSGITLSAAFCFASWRMFHGECNRPWSINPIWLGLLSLLLGSWDWGFWWSVGQRAFSKKQVHTSARRARRQNRGVSPQSHVSPARCLVFPSSCFSLSFRHRWVCTHTNCWDKIPKRWGRRAQSFMGGVVTHPGLSNAGYPLQTRSLGPPLISCASGIGLEFRTPMLWNWRERVRPISWKSGKGYMVNNGQRRNVTKI